MSTSTRTSQPFALPRDTVLYYPCVDHGMVYLVSVDSEGEPRMELKVATDKAADVEIRMLRWTRENYPSRIHLVD
jgi:hypothetical protein